MDKALYDVTMDLKDEYTALVNRVVGQELHTALVQHLREVDEPGVLILDFSVVTSIHISFLDEFLVPVLQELRSGTFGDRYLIGANVNMRNLALGDLGTLMSRNDLLFLFYDKKGSPVILGATSERLNQALGYVQRTEKETAQQLALQMAIPDSEATDLLLTLANNRLIRRGRLSPDGPEFYDAILPPSTSSRFVRTSIEDELLDRLEHLGAIERTAHYQLPSGAHAAEFLHLSRVFEDARFIAKATYVLGDMLRERDLDVIITTKTPNNVVLAQFLGEYLNCRVVSTVFDGVKGRLVPASGIELKKGEKALVLVDVISTGWIGLQLIECARHADVQVQAVASFIDASGESVGFTPYPYLKLASLKLNVYQPGTCPLCMQNIPWVAVDILPKA